MTQRASKYIVVIVTAFAELVLCSVGQAEGKGSFTGMITLDGPQPLAGARVAYNNIPRLIPLPGGGYEYAEPPVSGSVITDETGRFTVSETPAGSYVFCASGTQPTHLRSCQWQYGIFPANFEVTSNTTTNLGSVSIRTGAMVTFVVNDPTGVIKIRDLSGINSSQTTLIAAVSWPTPDGSGRHTYGSKYVSTVGSQWTYQVPVLMRTTLQLFFSPAGIMKIFNQQGQELQFMTPTGIPFQVTEANGITINLSVQPTGTVVIGASTNGASFSPGIAPGGIATTFDQNITSATGIFQASALPLPTEINGTAVSINGVRCPLYAVARVNGLEQVNFQVPSGLNVPGVDVIVSLNGVERPPISTNLFPAMPGIFTVNGIHGSIQHGSDFRLVTSTDPAIRGAPVVIYATGLGPVTPDPGAGNPAPASPPSITTYPITVTVGGVPATVTFAGLAAGYVGLNQVNIVVPPNAPTGEVDVVLSALVDDLTFSSPPVKMFLQ